MGTSQPDAGRERTRTILSGVGRNPNVGAALVVELGTEDLTADAVADDVASSGKPVETLSVREAGGTRGALDAGVERVEALYDEVCDQSREEADASELVFGLECGGSDFTSGLASNPAVGNAADRLVEAGGAACLSETPEFIGAEHIMAERCVDAETRERLLDRVDHREGLAELMGADLRDTQPSPGNQEGGLTTIEEKSLGAVAKGGTTPIEHVVDFGEEIPVGGGLTVMDSPGYDVESVVGKVAAGAQVVAFTTGRGSTTGNPVAPVIKVTGNPRTADRLASNMDVDVSTILDGEELAAAGERVYRTLLSVADGTRTAAETRRLEEFAINERQPRELAALEGES